MKESSGTAPHRRTRSVEELAEILGIGRNTAYDLVRTNAINSIRVGRRILIPLQAIDAFLARNEEG